VGVNFAAGVLLNRVETRVLGVVETRVLGAIKMVGKLGLEAKLEGFLLMGTVKKT
jgi:hypothetical protein